MTKHLLSLSSNDLTGLALALKSGRLVRPFSPIGIRRILATGTVAGVLLDLERLTDSGWSPDQIGSFLDMIVADRRSRPALEDRIDLVTTGPDVAGVVNRDTSVVVRELFSTATSSVLIAGYAVYQGQKVFRALADRMQERPELEVRIILDIQRGLGDSSSASELVKRFAARFRSHQWPSGRPFPELFFDPRSVEQQAERRTCMHAKCIVVDLHSVFVSSANFTEAAQQRNIEVGLIIRSSQLADRVTLFFSSMISAGFLSSIPMIELEAPG
ncbi:DISARM system phospholipase D-like protein DrmC [Paludisphaera soli]|uniref:DISARM system phospholipase D-like protein DrmC n=1 Tax=Paludisphaera soli TaxID=2712865 RepID=UPI0013EA5EC2|nr:DISARM system phospholipase D-like protein DrmC [Paludisphaera soli]